MTEQNEYENVVQVPIEWIEPGNNDRTVFDYNDLNDLATSIADHGLAQPILIRPIGVRSEPDSTGEVKQHQLYEIVAGERRYRACKTILMKTTIPAIIRDMSDEEASAIMLIENVHRVDLNPMDEARGYQKRIDQFGWTISRIAKETGVGAKRIDARLSLLGLIPEMQHLIEYNHVGVQFGETMVALDPNRQRIALKYITSNEKPLLRELQAIVGKLLADQVQDSLFSLSDLVQQAVAEEKEHHDSKYSRDYPVAGDMPPFKKMGGLGISMEHYIANLVRTGNVHAAAIVGRIYEGMIQCGFCHPPKEGSPLEQAIETVKKGEDVELVFIEQFSTARFNKLEAD